MFNSNRRSTNTPDITHHAPTDRLLTLAQVTEIVSLSKSTIYELTKIGLFPAQCKIAGGASRWIEREVQDGSLNRLRSVSTDHGQGTASPVRSAGGDDNQAWPACRRR